MKQWLWNLRVKLGDRVRVWYRRIHPVKNRYTLEIHDSELRIGD